MRLPHHLVEFRTDGSPETPESIPGTVRFAQTQATAGVTDLLVLAHGWNNDMGQARQRYTRLCDHVDRLRDERDLPDGRVAVVGLLWPSVQWADDDQVAGGGLSAVAEPLTALTDRIVSAVEDPLSAGRLVQLAPDLEASAAAREAFVGQLRTMLPPEEEVDDDDAPPTTLTSGAVEELFEVTGEGVDELDDGLGSSPETDPASLPPGFFPTDDEDAGGGAAFGLGDRSLLDVGRQLLNLTTYYRMKKRSGAVAARGLVPLLDAMEGAGLRTHLVGHSFGARLVTSAAARTSTTYASLTLLQGAFSHRGFAPDDGVTGKPGAFRAVLTSGLDGPVVVTHTRNDRAVGLAYAVASRLARQAGAGIGGGPDDVYGGIGANGAVSTDEADEGVLGDTDAQYAFQARRIHNLRADATIDSHGDVSNPAVANALLQAISLS